MSEETPQWAKERACELINNEHPGWKYTPNEVSISPALRAFARYIAAHEEEPVDPDLIEAREICALTTISNCNAEAYRSGEIDHATIIQTALAAIKRGRELERGG